MSMHVPLMTETVVSHNFGIPAFEGNPISSVQAGGTRNTLFAWLARSPNVSPILG